MSVIDSMKLCRKGRRTVICSSQYNFITHKVCVYGTYKDGKIFISDSPSNNIIYYSCGFFGTPIEHEVVDESKENESDKIVVVRSSRSNWVINGHLQLTREEAFYISYAFGGLAVRVNDEVCCLRELWRRFCSDDPDFVPKYIVYHYFRAKNWVVKGGLKLGTEYILYKDGPPFYHASYVVKIHEIKDRSSEAPAFYSWNELAGSIRVANQVVKDLLICNVIWPEEMNLQDVLDSPECLSSFEVQEVLAKRWVASEEREAEDLLL